MRYRYNPRFLSARYEEFDQILFDPKLVLDPDFMHLWADKYWQPTPQSIVDACIKNTNPDTIAGFPPAGETPEFKEAIAEKLRKENNIIVNDPQKEIGYCHGIAGGFKAACDVFLDIADEALVLDPSFTYAWGLCDETGTKAVSVPITEGQDWNIRPENVPDLLEPLISKNTKMFIATHPGNPTGTVFSRATLEAIGDILRDHEILFLEDCAYERRIYDGRKFVPMAAIPEMRDYVITIMGFDKIYNTMSLRTGYIFANEDIVRKIWKWHMLDGVDPPAIFRKALITALTMDQSFHDAYLEEWDTMRRYAYNEIRKIPGVTLRMPHSGTFHYVNTSRLGTTQEVFAYLRDTEKVLVTPGPWYGPSGEGYVRICYATYPPEKTKEGVQRIVDGLTTLAKQKGIT
jgi:aspartate/methionine/tyrosine aminotransferase